MPIVILRSLVVLHAVVVELNDSTRVPEVSSLAIVVIPVTFECSDVVCLELITLADGTSPTVISGVPVNPDALVAVVELVALVAVSALPVTSQ